MRTVPRLPARLIALAAGAALAIPVAGPIATAAGSGVHAAAYVDVVTPATGGAAIPSTTAHVGGTGEWTQLHGPVLQEAALGDLTVGMVIHLFLPDNVEWDQLRAGTPTISDCRLGVRPIEYATERTAKVTLTFRIGGPASTPCRIDFGSILQARPIVNRASVPDSTGTFRIQVRHEMHAGGPVYLEPAEDAGQVRVVVPPPTIVPATGGAAIPSTTARIGGDGTWTHLVGPRIVTLSPASLAAGEWLFLDLPDDFEWNPTKTAPPIVMGCSRTARETGYVRSNNGLRIRMEAEAPADGETGACSIDFGTLLEIRPVDAGATAGTAGEIGVVTSTADGILSPVPGSAGHIAMVHVVPPTAVTLGLTATSPTMINGAIVWGEGVDLVTTGPTGTTFSLQVTTDASTWETLSDATGTPLAFTIGADGTATYRYRPMRNYWYRAVSGGSTSPAPYPRVTVRETIVIRPIHTGVRRVSSGTAVTFTATVRPARPDVPRTTVRFELYRRTGSRWMLSRSVTVGIDGAGVASTTFTFGAGRWYVRAQAQPTQVNANSLWTPNQLYTAD